MLAVDHLKMTYQAPNGEVCAVEDITFTLKPGQFLSVVGPSGCGKSTLLSILSGNLRPDAGRVMLDGHDLTAMRERELARVRRTSLGFVYQSLNLVPTLNAADNILLPLVLDRADLRGGRERMREFAETLRISHLLGAFPKTMSGGERQRVAIARAMVHRPSVLMLDEPTGSLDARSTEEVMELLRELNQTHGVTVIQVTHSTLTAGYGNRTVTLTDGRLTES